VKNKLVDLGNDNGYQGWDKMQGLGYRLLRKERSGNIPLFLWLQIQRHLPEPWMKIRAYTNAKRVQMIQPKAVPGDVRWVDVNMATAK
jgi:hypothetical protein